MEKENFDNFSNEQNKTERNVKKFLEEEKVGHIISFLRNIFTENRDEEINLKIFYRDYDNAGKNIKVAEGNFKFDEDDKILRNMKNNKEIDLKDIEKIILPNGEKKNFYE